MSDRKENPDFPTAWRELTNLLARLKLLNSTGTILPGWYGNMLGSFAAELGLRLVGMTKACQERRLADLAYNARNALELYVWAEYCTKSEQNARSFREDIFRDSKGLYEALQSLTTLFPSRPDASNATAGLKDLDRVISNKALQLFGISAIDSNYKRVRAAARAAGIESFFVNTNTVFSKIAHPTALVVLAFPKDKPLGDICDAVFNMGLYPAGAAIASILGFIRGLGVTL